MGDQPPITYIEDLILRLSLLYFPSLFYRLIIFINVNWRAYLALFRFLDREKIYSNTVQQNT